MIAICDGLAVRCFLSNGFLQQDPVRKVSLLRGRRGVLIATYQDLSRDFQINEACFEHRLSIYQIVIRVLCLFSPGYFTPLLFVL